LLDEKNDFSSAPKLLKFLDQLEKKAEMLSQNQEKNNRIYILKEQIENKKNLLDVIKKF
jgi:hypothetical protein